MDPLINPEEAAPVSFQVQQQLAPVPRPRASPVTQPYRRVRVAIVGCDTCVHLVKQQLELDKRTELVFRARTLSEGRHLPAFQAIDVLLVELDLEDGDGLDLVLHVKDNHPTAEAIVMTRFDDEEAALRGFELGAAGWLVLHSGYTRLVTSVLNVANGGFALTPSLARRLLRRPARVEDRPAPTGNTLKSLTDREREVLGEVALGLSGKEIARRLTISGETVNAHVKNIYRKLQVHSRAQLVRMASQAGIF